MSSGFIILPRSCIEWGFRNDHNTFSVAIHLLMMASYTATEWKGIKIERGQCITSLSKLAQRCNLTVKQIRGILTKLEGQGFLARKGTKLYSIITICNYDSYQGAESKEGQSEGQSEGATKNKLYNKISQEKEVTINSKGVFSEESKKMSLKESYSSFLNDALYLCPIISKCMTPLSKSKYIALRGKYSDSELLAILEHIENYKDWHSMKSMKAAINRYLQHKESLPDFKNDIP